MSRREARFQEKLHKYKGKKRIQRKPKFRVIVFPGSGKSYPKVSSYSPEVYEVLK